MRLSDYQIANQTGLHLPATLYLARRYAIQVKPDGSDEYEKNLVFESKRYRSRLFIHRDTGISKSSGNLSYLKVAVHPTYFNEKLVNPSAGVEDFINRRIGINRHASSNYIDFPRYEGTHEPCGRCYKVDGLIPLEMLLAGLQDH